MRYDTEALIKAYQETGSIWKAGKKLGIPGQTVHSKLVAVGYKFANSQWTDEELDELRELAGHHTIAQIASKLGRPYNGVAIKISRLGLANNYGNTGQRKPPRTTAYSKDNTKKYSQEIASMGLRLRQYALMRNLNLENLVQALQRYEPKWWQEYVETHAAKPKTNCPYCNVEFWPLSGKQVYCSRKCGNDARTDNGYFGGRRRETIGLAEKTCQLCGRQNVKGLSSHHMIGKENDPENEYLVALCPGCHQLVTILGSRAFAGTSEVWESLIQLAMIRKFGHDKNIGAVYCSVEIEILSKEEAALYE